MDAVGSDRDRIEQLIGLDVILLLRQVGLDKGSEIGLPEHDVGGRSVAGGDAVEDQDAVVLRVGHIEAAVLNPYALRAAHGLRIRRAARQGRAGEVGLAHDNVCRCIVAGGYAVPDEHAVVVGVRHHDVNAIGGHGGGQAQRGGSGREIQGRGGEIRLAQDHRGMTDTDGTLAVVVQRIGGLGQHAGKVLEKEHAMIAGRGSDAV